MFKKHISMAFRRLPIKEQHLKFMVVLFKYKGITWRAQHLTCPFGAVGSVTAWHRVSSFLKNVMIRCTRSILGRYVDDFFGVDLPDLYWTTPKMFTALCSLVGAPCDPGKAAYEMTQMAFLGALILIDFGNWSYSHKILPDKAHKLANELRGIMEDKVLPPGQAAKIVGKLNFANQLAHGRFGRAFLRPLIRCIHAPLRDNMVSTWTLRVIQWWIEVLQQEAVEWQCMIIKTPLGHAQRGWSSLSRPLCDRNVVVSWTDAASTTRLLSAVFFDGEKFEYTRMVAPAQILDDLVQRNDGMIGVLELLAVLLVLETWREALRYARWQAYIDNDGVLYSIINASSKASDVNLIVGKLWRNLHTLATDLIAFRIESKANIGDAPSRLEDEEELHDLKHLGAEFVNPRLPPFLYTVWVAPTHHVCDF